MDVFISSVISGLEPYRASAERALQAYANDHGTPLTILRSEPHAAAASPSIDICRRMVAQADVVVGIYGPRYGSIDSETGLSITHLELRWATETYHKPLLGFLVDRQHAEPSQQALIRELEDFRLGVFRKEVSDPSNLEHELYRSLHLHTAKISFESSLVARYTNILDKDLYHHAAPLRSTDEFAEMSEPTTDCDPLLIQRLKELLADQVNAAFVLGEAGSGKTWFAKSAFCSHLDEYMRRETDILPIYIDLSQVNGTELRTSPNPVSLLLDQQYNAKSYIPSESFGEVLPNAFSRGVLVLLDGFDELVAKSEPGAKLHLLDRILLFLTSRAKLVLTSRSQLFETEESLDRFMELASYSVERRPEPVRLYPHAIFVKALRADDVKEYLAAEYGEEAPALWTKMLHIVDLSDLAKRPMLLPMICKSLREHVDFRDVEPVTAGYLYRVYTSLWLSRESWRLGFDDRSARIFFEEIALRFHNAGEDAMLFADIVGAFPEFFPTTALFSAERQHLEEALRTATFFTNDPEGEYRFLHRSFLEYFLAERIVRAIQTRDRQFVLERFPSKVTDGFIQDLLLHGTGWEEKIIALLAGSPSMILRYLMAYLANRLTSSERRLLSPDGLRERVLPLVAAEEDPVVVRELLFTLLNHGIVVDRAAIQRHLDAPIPHDLKLRELQEYYGSLAEAREYVRERSNTLIQSPLRLFYLISLSEIPTPEDIPLFEECLESEDPFLQTVANRALERIRAQESTASGKLVRAE